MQEINKAERCSHPPHGCASCPDWRRQGPSGPLSASGPRGTQVASKEEEKAEIETVEEGHRKEIFKRSWKRVEKGGRKEAEGAQREPQTEAVTGKWNNRGGEWDT